MPQKWMNKQKIIILLLYFIEKYQAHLKENAEHLCLNHVDMINVTLKSDSRVLNKW